jgi:hypothetical protein
LLQGLPAEGTISAVMAYMIEDFFKVGVCGCSYLLWCASGVCVVWVGGWMVLSVCERKAP